MRCSGFAFQECGRGASEREGRAGLRTLVAVTGVCREQGASQNVTKVHMGDLLTLEQSDRHETAAFAHLSAF